MDDPLWLTYALRELGVREVPGPADEARVLEYLSATDYSEPLHDEIPWCSAFACWCVEQAGLRSPRKANARAWLHWGVALQAPRRGCLAVYSRGDNPNAGHVGFWLQRIGENDVLLGGNQSDCVCIAPRSRRELLGYRMLLGAV